MLLATFLVLFFLPSSPSRSSSSSSPPASSWQRLRRVDFVGSGLLALALLAFLIPMEIGGNKVSWTHPIIPGLFVASAVLFFVFLRSEERAAEPVVPLDIFHIRDVNLSLLTQMLQTAAQLGVRSNACVSLLRHPC